MSKQNKKSNPALHIAIVALFINIITASIYIYQASIMREEQHASVWPHVEWRLSYIGGESLIFTVKNNGVGPALIKEATMRFDGAEVPSIDSLLTLAVGTTNLPYIYDVVENRVLSAGDQVRILEVRNSEWTDDLFYQLGRSGDFKYSIMYESIHGQQWISNGFEVIKLND